jgi:hypothetical protein
MQKLFVRRDIRHRLPVMRKADIAFCIDDAIERHASQLEQVHFLPVGPGHGVVRVRQSDEGDLLILPVLLKDGQGVRTHGENFRAPAGELLIFVPQAR